MSSKRAKDYEAVLGALLNLLPVEPNVEEFVSDFEQVFWLGVRRTQRACKNGWLLFSLELVLGPAYVKKSSETRKICRLMCLPFLPPHKIVRIYNKLKQSAVGKVKELCQYIFRTWISSLTAKWPPKTWSVFMRVVRTNNDAEGWHNRLNQKKSCSPP